MHDLLFAPRLLHVMQGLCRPIFYRFFNIQRHAEALEGLEPPYVILANHSDWWDPFFLMLDVDRPTHFVATEDLFSLFPYGLFIGRLGAIPKVKFLPDLDTVKSLFKARDLGRSIGIFPEGERNWDGRTLPLVPATLKLIRKLKEPVVVVILKGAHLSFPRWAYFSRRGRIDLDYRVVATREEAAALSGDELIGRIRVAFDYDEHAWNRVQRIAFRGPGRSLGIEALLYLCPRCGRADGIRGGTSGRVRCACGLEARLDESGEFLQPIRPGAGRGAEDGESFRDPGAWHRWEKAALTTALDAALDRGEGTSAISPDLTRLKRIEGSAAPLMAECGVRLYRRERSRGRVRLLCLMRCDMQLYADRILFQGRAARQENLLAEIGGMNVLYRNLFDFAVGEDLYRVRPRAASRSLLKFLHAARHLAARSGSKVLGSES